MIAAGVVDIAALPTTCPAWCTADHEWELDVDGSAFQVHRADVGAVEREGDTLLAYISAWEFVGGNEATAEVKPAELIVVDQIGLSGCVDVDPQVAREVAALLVRGADWVETIRRAQR